MAGDSLEQIHGLEVKHKTDNSGIADLSLTWPINITNPCWRPDEILFTPNKKREKYT